MGVPIGQWCNIVAYEIPWYPIKMACEVSCSEDFVTDSNAQGDTLVLKKKTKAFYGSILGLKQIVTAVRVVSTCLSAICTKL